MQFWTTDDDVSQCIFLGLKVDILRYTMEAKLNLPICFNFVIFWVWSALKGGGGAGRISGEILF